MSTAGRPNKKLVLTAGVYPRRSTVLRCTEEEVPGTGYPRK